MWPKCGTTLARSGLNWTGLGSRVHLTNSATPGQHVPHDAKCGPGMADISNPDDMPVVAVSGPGLKQIWLKEGGPDLAQMIP